MTNEQIGEMIKVLEAARERPGMYMACATPEAVRAWLDGVDIALDVLDGVRPKDLDVKWRVIAELGWKFPSLGLGVWLREQGFSDVEIVDAEFAVKIECWKRMLAARDGEETRRTADIKITLSGDDTKYAADIDKEAQWLEEEGELFHSIAGRPLHAEPGCWVYFILDGQAVGRACAEDFVEVDPVQLSTYKGVTRGRGRYFVKVVPPLHKAVTPFAHKGFQGFRYVGDDEREQFEAAFKS